MVASTHSRLHILYIRQPRTYTIAEGMRANQDEWLETLSLLADVTLLTSDFDMEKVCTEHQPDFILYEAPFLRARPLCIENPKAHIEIPRFAFQIQDPYCATRVYFLHVVEELGIHWIFTHMADMVLRLSPELKARTFSLPHLFDDRIFRDYGEKKDIPVSIFGAHLVPEMYNWRADIASDIAEYFPTLLYTHPGYVAPVPRHKFQVTGEDYARLLSRSHFSLADTTRFDCFLRKHLEIPACGAVLVAPDAPALKPYGFRDMENCILGSGKELYNKMAAVADNPLIYEKIRKSGHDLVHGRYRREQWRGILDFYESLRRLKPSETIRQHQILGTFEIVPEASASPTAITEQYPDNETSTLSTLWMRHLISGEGADALERKTLELSRWLQTYVTEMWMPMGIAALLKGETAQAKELFLRPHKIRVQECGLESFDPEEIAWLSLTASLLGDHELREVTKRALLGVNHLGLRRLQWLGRFLSNGAEKIETDILQRKKDDLLSVHWTGQMAWSDWLTVIKRILTAHGQAEAVARLPA